MKMERQVTLTLSDLDHLAVWSTIKLPSSAPVAVYEESLRHISGENQLRISLEVARLIMKRPFPGQLSKEALCP
jgi:hypothetical protein